ncbi:MAG TPA: hypothetical protein VE988_25160 [Gemmataceae bacterium]|nr:hypothetical protein [Gemmataceae bacterium]
MLNYLALSNWLRRTIGLLALAPAFFNCGFTVAQTGSVEPVAGKYYTNDRVFDLPIKIDQAARGSTREVQLFVKPAGGEWQKQQVAAPWQPAFKYKTPADGEYWFTLVTVNNKGEQLPPDLNRLSGSEVLMVVVDTQLPTFDVQPIKAANGDLLVRCVVNDANPDYQSLRIVYQGPDQSPHFLEPVVAQPGTFRAPNAEIFANPLRVSAKDLAGNLGARNVNLQELVAKLMPTPQPAAIVQTNTQVQSNTTNVQQAAGTSPNTIGAGVVQSAANQTPTNVLPVEPKGVANPPVQTIVQPPETKIVAIPQVQTNLQPAETKIVQPVSVASNPPAGTLQRQLINTTRASLDYRIDQVGPSGVGKVEVWMTGDQGVNWKRLCEDADRRTPAEFDLPGDGLYGVRVIVTNGNGFGGKPPVPGEQPQLWIEVDTAAPLVHLKEVEPTSNGGTIDIRWSVSDKNLGTDPINLFYATRREGPWQPMARNLKNDGLYRWAFPRDAGSQFFVRLEVADMAGNLARSDSPNAIMLDMTEPRASVVGVSGVQPVIVPKSGN